MVIGFTSVIYLWQSVNINGRGCDKISYNRTSFFKFSQYRKNLKSLDNKMCQWPNLSRDIPEMCLQGSWKPALFILTWNMIHMLHTTCVRIDLMKFYSLNSTFCLFVPLSRLLLHKSWSIHWCLRRKICESRVREAIINS